MNDFIEESITRIFKSCKKQQTYSSYYNHHKGYIYYESTLGYFRVTAWHNMNKEICVEAFLLNKLIYENKLQRKEELEDALLEARQIILDICNKSTSILESK